MIKLIAIYGFIPNVIIVFFVLFGGFSNEVKVDLVIIQVVILLIQLLCGLYEWRKVK